MPFFKGFRPFFADWQPISYTLDLFQRYGLTPIARDIVREAPAGIPKSL
jgi:hypothetical protein